MKRSIAVISVLITIILALLLASCSNGNDSKGGKKETKEAVVDILSQSDESIWKDATYTEDTTFGTGKTMINLEVSASGKTVNFTINTDREILSDALLDLDLISGNSSEQGFYVTTVDGMYADYDKDGTYWALYKGTEYSETSADKTKIEADKTYAFVYSAIS